MSVRATTVAFAFAFAFALAAATSTSVADASPAALSEVRAVYRSVLTAEYFGPASAVCSRLTASGRMSFTAGGAGSCQRAFDRQQHVLKHKTAGVDDSGYTASGWRRVVAAVMAHLTVSVHGSRANTIGPSGIPGQTELVKVNGRWLVNSYPPSIQP